MSARPLTALRVLLFEPAAFFEERPPRETLPMALGVVVLCAVVLLAALLALPTVLGGAIEGPITVDNPDRPAEPFCSDDHPHDDMFEDRCDEPETIEKSPEELLRDALSGFYAMVLVGMVLLWGLGSVSFYLMARLVGGAPSFSGAASLAGWAALPELVRVPVAFLGIWYAVSDVTIDDPEAEVSVLVDAIGAVEPLFVGLTLFTAAWQWYIVRGGLQHDADLGHRTASLAAGVPLAVSVLLALA